MIGSAHRRLGLVLFVALVCLGAGRQKTGDVVVFLAADLAPEAAAEVRLDRLDVLDGDEVVVVLDRPDLLRSARFEGGPVEIARTRLPRGSYDGLRLTLAGPVVLDVDLPFRVEADTATSLFLTWDGGDGSAERPMRLSGRVEQPELRSLLLFVSNRGGEELTVIQRHTGRVVGVVKVGRQPMGLATDSAGRRLYVANAGSNTISVIDTLERRVLDTIRLDFGARPVDVELSPDGRRLFVVAADSGTVLAFDTASLSQLAETEVGVGPERVVVAPDGSALYVANRLSNSVTLLDARTLDVQGTVPVEPRPIEMVVDPRSGRVFVSHESSGAVVLLGSNRTVESVSNYGAAIHGMALDPAGRRLFLSAGAIDRLYFGQPRTENITASVILTSPGRVAVDPDGKKIYVLDTEKNRVHVVSRLVARVEGEIPTGSDPYDLVVLP